MANLEYFRVRRTSGRFGFLPRSLRLVMPVLRASVVRGDPSVVWRRAGRAFFRPARFLGPFFREILGVEAMFSTVE